MFLALISAAFACDPSDLVKALEEGEGGFGKNDPSMVDHALKGVSKGLRCTTPTPEQAARMHRLSAYGAGLQRDWVKAESSWRSSLAAHPLLEPQPALYHHPRLHLAWIRAQERGVTYTIGTTQTELAGVQTPLVPDTKPFGGTARGRTKALRFSALGIGLVAGGLYGGALVSKSGYNKRSCTGSFENDETCTPQSLKDRKSSYLITNTLSIASVGTAVLGGSLLAVSFAK